MSAGLRSGYVYVLHNGLDNDHVKVGWTRASAEERARELSRQTGVRCPFGVAFSYHFEEAEAAEGRVHRRLDRYRIPYKEFFRVSVAEAVKAVLEEAASVEERKGLGPLFERVRSGRPSRSVAFDPAPSSPWARFKNLVIEADELLAELGADAGGGALAALVHRLAWEDGVSPVRWLMENEALARSLAPLPSWPDVPEPLRREVQATVGQLKQRPSDPSFL